jgi:hypothetical protein
MDVNVCASLILGQVSIWMGTLFAVGWSVMFSMLVRHVWTYRGEASTMLLPMEPPAIGLTLGTVSLLLALMGKHPIPAPAVAGVVLNGLALGLAVALVVGCLS